MGKYSPARAGCGFTLAPLGPEPASDRVNAARLGLHREFRRQIASTFHGAGWCAIPRWPRRSVPGPRERLGKFRAPCGRSPSAVAQQRWIAYRVRLSDFHYAFADLGRRPTEKIRYLFDGITMVTPPSS